MFVLYSDLRSVLDGDAVLRVAWRGRSYIVLVLTCDRNGYRRALWAKYRVTFGPVVLIAGRSFMTHSLKPGFHYSDISISKITKDEFCSEV